MPLQCFRQVVLCFLTMMLLAAGCRPAGAQGVSATQELDAVFEAARVASEAPGASATIYQDGKLVWQAAGGVADLNTNLAASPSTLYSLASVTKMFTATMVLRLYEQGLLGLDDPIAAYVQSYIPNSDAVTIRDLLGMTSGYPEVENDPLVLLWLADPNHMWTREQILRRVTPVLFEPGSEYQYLNTNYVMLGGVIETLSPMGVGGEFDRLIVQPAGITGQAYFDRVPWAAPRIAHGYAEAGGNLRDTFAKAERMGVPTSIWGVVWTDGGIAATATGVAQFTDALFGGRLLQPETLAMMMEPGPDGSYGLGTYRFRFDGHEWQGHGGSYTGYTTATFSDLSRKLTITVLTNLTKLQPPSAAYGIWYQLAKAYDELGAGRGK